MILIACNQNDFDLYSNVRNEKTKASEGFLGR